MKAIILAAGEGRRLRPLTQINPKCMVKLFGKSILEWQICVYKSCNINNIVVVTGYYNDKINLSNITKYVNKEYDSTNMLESLFCVKKEFNEPVIVSYGDIVFEKKVLQSIIDSDYDISVVIDKNWKELWDARMDNPLDDVESLKIDSEGYLIDIGQKLSSSIEEIEGQYIGLIKFQNNGIECVLNFYEKMKKEFEKTAKNPLNPSLSFKQSYLTDFIRGLIHAGYKVKAVPIHNGWIELDSYRDYLVYNNLYENRTLSKFIHLGEL